MADVGSTETANAASLREIWRQLFDERDLSDPSRYWTDNGCDDFLAAGQAPRGPVELKAWFTAQFAAMPDWRMEITNIVDDGAGQLAVEWIGTGTFTGAPWLGFQPTGRRIVFKGCDVIRMSADGRMDQTTVYFDGAAFARQVGMLPPAGSAADRLATTAFNSFTRLRSLIRR